MHSWDILKLSKIFFLPWINSPLLVVLFNPREIVYFILKIISITELHREREDGECNLPGILIDAVLNYWYMDKGGINIKMQLVH